MKNTLYNRLKEIRIDRESIVTIVCILLSISLIAAPVVGQTVSGESAKSDFEDQSISGWEHPPSGTEPTLSTESVRGNYSLLAETEYLSDDNSGTSTFEWVSGPTLDLQEEFRVEGTVKPEWEDGTIPIRIGISGDDQREIGENAFIIFSREDLETYVSTTGTDTGRGNGTVAKSFDGKWVNFEIYSAGDGKLEAKVWEYGTTEPSTFQLSTNEFDGDAGSFGVSAGGSTASVRNVYLDEVTITGTLETDTNLLIDTKNYLRFGESQDYVVYDLIGEADIRKDVTDNATVRSGNTTVITVNESANTLTATANRNVSTRVNITATYNGRNTVKQVTVATQTLDNLDVLPFVGRLSAMFLDRSFQLILSSLLMAIAATRIGGVFAGLGTYQMGITAGWLIGWVPIGLAFVGLFSTLFIGLNIAANIDYSVRR